MSNGVTHHDEAIARRNGVIVVKTLSGEYAAMCAWSGTVLRRGNQSWVMLEMERQHIPVRELYTVLHTELKVIQKS
jgi:hypothetical protein